MRDRVLFLGLITVLTLSPSQGFSQTQAMQNRIPQQIIVNGQMASGAYVTAGGGVQSFSCPMPQHYTTADGSSQGWACYEQTTGVWLLNAVPPTQPQVAPAPAPAPAPVSPPFQQHSPAVVYPQAPQVVVYPQAQPTVVYQQAPATIVYQRPPTVIYQEPAPTVVYASPRPVVVAPVYPSSVVLGRATIEAAGRIAAAAILNSRRATNNYYYYDDYDRYRDRKYRDTRNHGRRW